MSNVITLKQAAEPKQIKDRIKKALERSAKIEADNIKVAVEGHKVKLRGKVNSIREKEEARRAAFSLPAFMIWKLYS